MYDAEHTMFFCYDCITRNVNISQYKEFVMGDFSAKIGSGEHVMDREGLGQINENGKLFCVSTLHRDWR